MIDVNISSDTDLIGVYVVAYKLGLTKRAVPCLSLLIEYSVFVENTRC